MVKLSKNVTIKTAVIVLILISIASSAYILYHRFHDKSFTGSGKIDIGGYSLFIKSTGEGNPTVVFDTGYGMPCTQWDKVLELIGTQTKTVVYDRAGIGESDKSLQKDRTCEIKAEELHKLLKAAKIKSPYILVGHSIGGLTMRIFAAKYPDEVAGIVLVDSTHENMEEKIMSTMDEEGKKTYLEQLEIVKAQTNTPDGIYDDIENSYSQVREIRTAIKNIPVTAIVSQGNIDGMGNLWLELQEEVASLSTKNNVIIAKNSGHNIPNDEPDVIANAILDMLEVIK